jgi:hypothetical protein
MRQHIEDNLILYGQKPVVDRVIYYLALVSHYNDRKRTSSLFIAPRAKKDLAIDSTSKCNTVVQR